MTKPAEPDQIAKARRFREQIRDNHVLRVVGAGLATRAEYDEPAIMAAFAESERQAVKEECCRAVCKSCADGVPLRHVSWHWTHEVPGIGIGPCHAAAIRSME